MHGSHALIETVAAIVLTVGGAAIVAGAWIDRVLGSGSRLEPRAVPDPAGASGGAAAILVALSSTGAAVIHLAAGPEHVEALGDLGLAFYWAAFLQGGFAISWVVSRRSPRLAAIGIAANAALIAVWLWSRTIGLGIAGGPEPIGLADSATVILEALVIAVLASGVSATRRFTPRGVGVPATSAAVAIGGVAVLATAIALVDIGGGHRHGADDSIHAARAVTR